VGLDSEASVDNIKVGIKSVGLDNIVSVYNSLSSVILANYSHIVNISKVVNIVLIIVDICFYLGSIVVIGNIVINSE